MLFLLLSACTVFEPLDGSWLFELDRNVSVSGDRTDGDSGGGTLTGTDNLWVDAYTLTGNSVAFEFRGLLLVGTFEGSAVQAEATVGSKNLGVTEIDKTSIAATLEGGTLTGTVTGDQSTIGSGDTYTCTVTQSFTAGKTTSSQEQYPTH
jgi:hypothetical protein